MFSTVRSVDEHEYSPGFTDEDIEALDFDFINNYLYNNRISKRSFNDREDGVINTCCTNPCDLYTLIEFCPPKRSGR